MSDIILENIKKVHVIGIGGIGISALAKYLHHIGKEVVGTNDVPSPQTLDELEARGVKIFYDIDVANIDADTDLVVHSDSWLTMQPDYMEQMRALGVPVKSYFEILGVITAGKRTITVAGTNGKTTTTGMLGKILIDAGISPNVVVGSVMADTKSNFMPGESDWFVVEACEWRDHLLELDPKYMILTNVELDHTDFFLDLAAVQASFRKAAERLPADGALITNPSDPNISVILDGLKCKVIDYSGIAVPELQLIGEFNKYNARAAKGAVQEIFPELQETGIDTSLGSFSGLMRRFEYKGTLANSARVYDDYAHHPIAITSTIVGIRERFPDKRITIAFHPHLYSRTKSLFDEFVTALAGADRVIVAPIFKAREIPDPSISHEMLAEKIAEQGTQAMALDTFEEIEQVLRTDSKRDDILVTMGAGDIYKVAEALTGDNK